MSDVCMTKFTWCFYGTHQFSVNRNLHMVFLQTTSTLFLCVHDLLDAFLHIYDLWGCFWQTSLPCLFFPSRRSTFKIAGCKIINSTMLKHNFHNIILHISSFQYLAEKALALGTWQTQHSNLFKQIILQEIDNTEVCTFTTPFIFGAYL